MTCLLVNRTTRRYFGLAYWIKLERILWNHSGVAYLVLRLGHEPSPSKVVRLSLPSPPILDLETADRYGSALMVTGEAESGVSRGSMIRSWDSKYARKISRTLNVFDKGHVDAERQLKVKAKKRFSRTPLSAFSFALGMIRREKVWQSSVSSVALLLSIHHVKGPQVNFTCIRKRQNPFCPHHRVIVLDHHHAVHSRCHPHTFPPTPFDSCWHDEPTCRESRRQDLQDGYGKRARRGRAWINQS